MKNLKLFSGIVNFLLGPRPATSNPLILQTVSHRSSTADLPPLKKERRRQSAVPHPHTNGHLKKVLFITRAGSVLTAKVVGRDGDTVFLSRHGGPRFERTLLSV